MTRLRYRNGRYAVVWRDGDKYRSLSLGRVSPETAARIADRIGALVHAKAYGVHPDDEVQAWVAKLSPKVRARLEAAGLLNGPRTGPTLREWGDEYLRRRPDLAAKTQDALVRVMQRLEKFFGPNTPLAAIKPPHAADWLNWLRTQGRGHRPLAENTIRKHVAFASQLFRDAQLRGVIPANPFAGIPRRCLPQPHKERFITAAETERWLDMIPDVEARVFIALGRYGGLRLPSEAFQLRWADIDWEKRRMVVRSPKTRRKGREARIVPIFPELLPYLEHAWEAAPEGAEFVLHHWRAIGDMPLRQYVKRYLRAAGMQPWPKLFMALRQSRAIELAREYPAHVATAWLGHSAQVAMRHYWRVTEEDYERAVRQPLARDTDDLQRGGHCDAPITDGHNAKD